jgi:uncharacterized protein (DUF488 family)
MSGRPATPAIRTLGHGTLDAAAFAAIARDAGVEMIVDVRRYPGSRRCPHFSEAEMSRWLPDSGLGYWWLPALGGRRKSEPDSPNRALQNDQFRAYADHMASAGFREGVAQLVALADAQAVALLCAESVWWRCHRRLIADHLVVVEQRPVAHCFHDGRREAHRPFPGLRRVGDHLVYDDAGSELPANRRRGDG